MVHSIVLRFWLEWSGVGSGSEFSTTRVKNYNGINGNGNYLVLAWPTAWGYPTFVVNGLLTRAFTRVNATYSLTNAYGYTASYDVWVSNTIQNSAIASFQIN
jgi:hypothetical protein